MLAVANSQLVEKAFEQIPSFDKNDDGRRWYTKADLEQFLKVKVGCISRLGPSTDILFLHYSLLARR